MYNRDNKNIFNYITIKIIQNKMQSKDMYASGTHNRMFKIITDTISGIWYQIYLLYKAMSSICLHMWSFTTSPCYSVYRGMCSNNFYCWRRAPRHTWRSSSWFLPRDHCWLSPRSYGNADTLSSAWHAGVLPRATRSLPGKWAGEDFSLYVSHCTI